MTETLYCFNAISLYSCDYFCYDRGIVRVRWDIFAITTLRAATITARRLLYGGGSPRPAVRQLSTSAIARQGRLRRGLFRATPTSGHTSGREGAAYQAVCGGYCQLQE